MIRSTSGEAHLASSRAEEAAIDVVDALKPDILAIARRAVGVGGGTGDPGGVRRSMTASQAGLRMVLVLATFAATDQIMGFALGVLGPDIRAGLGLSEATYGIIVAQRANAAVLVSLQLAFHLHRRPNRRLLALYAVAATGVGALLSAFASSAWPLFLAVGVTCPTAGAVWAVHRPMIMDGYVPAVRVRMMSLHEAGVVAGVVGGPIVVWLGSGAAGLSWRGALALIGVGALAVGATGLALRDPQPRRHDIDAAREAVDGALQQPGSAVGEAARLSFTETLRRLWLIPTVRRLLAVWAVLGVVVTPLVTYASFLLADRWRMGVGSRSVFVAAAWAFALPALAWSAPRGDRLFRDDPAKLVSACASAFGVMCGGLLLTAVAPVAPVALLGLGVALAASSVLIPALTVVTMSVVAPEARPATGALAATFLVAVGGQGGAIILGGLDRRFGVGIALEVLAVFAAAAALVVRRAAVTVNDDLDAMLASVVEEREIMALSRSGARLPMLACRHIDFAYGQLQVLFDVDFTVDDGEIVALLGTNGAGKSTLLRVVCGLGLPQRGTVRLRGVDITHTGAEKRVTMGISQVPGGRAVFPDLTVVDNLRVLGYTHGRNRRKVSNGIDVSFDAFPRLAERRNQLASTLSGGEQQMLGLATAFVVKPRLLLFDELSLGLAPKVVGELLDTIRRINADGTAVVLVEQSVNVALSVVDHAYFMEKGEVRFDGAAKTLLHRPDLLRSVFLEGSSQGLRGTSSPGGATPTRTNHAAPTKES